MWTPKFGLGDKVFVKMKGYPPWPAKVEGVADETPKKIKYHIYFYGTKQIAVCKQEEMFPFLENRVAYSKPKKYKGFKEAIQQAEAELGLSPLSQEVDTSLSELNASQQRTPSRASKRSLGDSRQPAKLDLPSEDIVGSVSEKRLKTSTNEHCLNPKEENEMLLSCLKIETKMLDIDINIQNSLNLKRADPDTCLKLLDELTHLPIRQIMLKKHPEVIYNLTKLQTYVGNIYNWNMSEDEEQIFSSKAQEIRSKSKIVINKLKSLFLIPNGKSFIEFFDEAVNKFRDHVKAMPSQDLFCLRNDPTEDV